MHSADVLAPPGWEPSLQAERPSATRAWVRLSLLVVVVLSTLFAWYSLPTAVNQRDLVTAASEDRVIAVQEVGPATLAWVRDDGRRFRTDLSWAPTRVSGADLPATASAAIAELDRLQDRPLHRRSTLLPAWLMWLAAGSSVAVLLALLLGGPPPRVGNRWFWFWVLWVPVVGPLAFLALSGPLPSGHRLFPGLDRRRRGGQIGFLFLATSIPFQLVLFIVRATLPGLVGWLLA